MAQRFAVLIFGLALAACSRGEPELMQAAANSSGNGPDEFAILPNDPLVEPEDYSSLPQPTPGGTNLADVNPDQTMLAALGGRYVAGSGAVSPLLAHVSRFGYNEDIRGILASEDLAFRDKNRGKVMERLFAVNVYFDSYEPMELDQREEFERLQALGIQSSAVPPDP